MFTTEELRLLEMACYCAAAVSRNDGHDAQADKFSDLARKCEENNKNWTPEHHEDDVKRWDVYLNGKKIDRVFSLQTTAEDVRRSLINHDGYDPQIVVKMGKN